MSKETFKHRWITCYEFEDGTPFIDMDDAAVAVPITESGEVLMIEEFSVALNQRVLLLPAGGVEQGEAAVDTVNRELQEEAGFKAARWDLLARLRPISKYVRCDFSVYLARDLQPSKLQGDEAYEISVEYVPLEQFEELIASGRLRDSNVIAALFLARSFLAKESRL